MYKRTSHESTAVISENSFPVLRQNYDEIIKILKHFNCWCIYIVT